MALYRKYRPASFAEVVGQEHVTEPLSVALSSGRINHAYLFSGPRGCGKTSSARILARSLNCVHGPTADPCGECDSCIALAPGGTGTLDVTELDAASHGGVDDTRDLRERAFFAPASSRYRVLIIDEAHMVTNAGFNALLKIVEEPPEHLIFIFATTEPEKVLPTIRSRTHHYPFRLLTPSSMRGLVERISAQEGVDVDPTVFPLVIRAGGGSPRDTLSVLDQLMAGAGEEGITYPRAVSLLGATEVALIDDSVDALAAGDGATLFRTVDKVVEAGHDPRRFAIDLLQRLRDLIMVQSVPQAIERGLVEAPVEQAETMHRQAESIGPATLARCADMVHEGLGSMRGATSPRLLLEILCAKLLLPAADESSVALLQRLESLEAGRPAVGAGAPVAAAGAAGGVGAVPGGGGRGDDDTAAASPAGASAPQSAGAAAPAEGRPKFVRRSQQQAAAAVPQAEPQTPAPAAPQAEPPVPAPAAPQAEPQTPAPAVPQAPAAAVPHEPAVAAPAAPSAPDAAPPVAVDPQPTPSQGEPAQAAQSAPAAQSAQPVAAPDPAVPVVPGESVAGQQAERQAQHGESEVRPHTQPADAPASPPTPAATPQAPSGPSEAPAAASVQPPAPAAPTPVPAEAPASSQASEPTEDPWRAKSAAEQAPLKSAEPTESSQPAGPAESQFQAAAAAPAPPAESRFQSAQAPAPETAPAETSPDSAPATAAASAGTALEAEDIRRAWPAIREAVRTRTRTVEVMLAGATVAAVNGRMIHLVHDYAPLAKRLSQPHNATAITDSITEVVGGEWTIECTSGSVPPGGAAPAPGPAAGGSGAAGAAGGAPGASQQPEPRGWERRLQGRTDAQSGGGAGGYDDIPPPPEEPEPEPDEPQGPPVTEDEMVDEARSGPQNLDHRTGEDIALALLKEHLGARPIER